MGDRIDLSPESWIEDEWLYTKSLGVALSWPGLGDEYYDATAFRISLSELPAIYGYREGEPWCYLWNFGHGPVLVAENGGRAPMMSIAVMLHLNAVILCAGSTESLRKLWEVIKEIEE